MEMFCGIDIGTSSARAVVCDSRGATLARSSCALEPVSVDGRCRTQNPQGWWSAVCHVLQDVKKGVDTAKIGSVAVDATSGTIVMVDDGLKTIGPGILYNDGRAQGYSDKVNAAAGNFIEKHGYRFSDSFALCKILWLRDHDPNFDKARKILHQSDFVNARLTGTVPSTDWSNALKSGCDLIEGGWGEFIGENLGFPVNRLPDKVVPPGEKIGEVCLEASRQTGLCAGTSVIAGASDGTASLFASGASQPGDFNSTLGSTLVLKGISRKQIHDSSGVVYCHKHPSGYWLPGGASNVGCNAINLRYAPQTLTRKKTLRWLGEGIDHFLPCPVIEYPLGDLTEERFPFLKQDIGQFIEGPAGSQAESYAATLQAIAFVERWCYEKLESLGAEVTRVFSTGGGSASRQWCQLRADVLRKPLLLVEETETAFGAAALAAVPIYGRLEDACAATIRIKETIEPGPRLFEEVYQAFRDSCNRRWGV